MIGTVAILACESARGGSCRWPPTRRDDARAGERARLAPCYRRSLELARKHEIRTIAFPGISTGIYGYPLREAADTAIATVLAELEPHTLPERVILCTYNELATMIMAEAFETLTRSPIAP